VQNFCVEVSKIFLQSLVTFTLENTADFTFRDTILYSKEIHQYFPYYQMNQMVSIKIDNKIYYNKADNDIMMVFEIICW
jgi:hypothetical protein